MARRVVPAVILLVALHARALAQGTDVVEVSNGDRFTGTVERLERARLSFRTSAAGVISIAWSQVVRLTTAGTFDLETLSGMRLSGVLASPSAGTLVVQTASGPASVDLPQVIRIVPANGGFRAQLTGAIDAGVHFLQANDAISYTLEAELRHNTPTYLTVADLSSRLAHQSDADTPTRRHLTISSLRRLPDRWFVFVLFEAQQSDELELDRRLLAGGGLGRTLVQSNTALLSTRAGIDYDSERYTASTTEHSAEAFGNVDWDWFGATATSTTLAATTYVSLERVRVRMEVEGRLRHTVFRNLYWAVSVVDSFDSHPPGDRPRSDLAVALTFGLMF